MMRVSWTHGDGGTVEVGVVVGFVGSKLGTLAIVVCGDGRLVEKDLSVLRFADWVH